MFAMNFNIGKNLKKDMACCLGNMIFWVFHFGFFQTGTLTQICIENGGAYSQDVY
jgi:hypothetical protein